MLVVVLVVKNSASDSNNGSFKHESNKVDPINGILNSFFCY